MNLETLSYQAAGEVGRVVLRRPEQHNAYSVQMRDDLHQVLSAARLDLDLKVVTFCGAGRSFCAGADLSEFGTAPGAFAARRIRFARDVWGLLRDLPVPTVAIMRGFAIGTGLELALLCSLRIAGDDLRLRMPEAQLGLMPAACGTQLLPRLAGQGEAAELFYRGAELGAEQALAAGLVDRVLPAARLEGAAETVVERLRSQPRERLVRAWRLLRLGDCMGPEEAAATERRIAALPTSTS